VTYSDTSQDEPDPPVASAEYDQFLSQLEDEYLKSLAGEIKATYIKGQDTPEFYSFVQQQKPAASFVTAYSIRWLYLMLAMLLILLAYLPDVLFQSDDSKSLLSRLLRRG
jgi:mxaL protein